MRPPDVYTDHHVRDVLVERASDWNAFIAKQTDALTRASTVNWTAFYRRLSGQRQFNALMNKIVDLIFQPHKDKDEREGSDPAKPPD
jgi:hypothetical protein